MTHVPYSLTHARGLEDVRGNKCLDLKTHILVEWLETMNLGLHVIDLPKKVIVGEGAIKELSNVMRELNLTTPIAIVAGPNVWRLYRDKLLEPLEEFTKDYEYFEASEPSLNYAEKLYIDIREYKPSLIIGFGGGKSIDLAKYIAMKLSIPFISVPTSASHDGITSPFASLRGTTKPYSIKAKAPLAIIADIDIIARAPIRLLRAGSGDLIAKLTAVRDWQLAHKLKNEYYGEYAASLALLSAKHVLRFANVIRRGGKEAARIVVEGLISSGVAMCIAGSTRPASGSEHLFSHALDIIAPGKALHGEQVALGTIMMMYLHGGNWRKIRKIMKKIGLPTKAKELGIRDTDVIRALTIAHSIRPERYTILGESGLTWEAAEKLAKTTGVID